MIISDLKSERTRVDNRVDNRSGEQIKMFRFIFRMSV